MNTKNILTNETNIGLEPVIASNQSKFCKAFLITTLKSVRNFNLFILLTFSLLTVSCKKENKTAQPKFSQQILNIVPLSTIDSLKRWGMTIYEGTTPPNLEGVYLVNNAECTFDNSNAQRLGIWRSDYKYRFYNQDNGKLTISLDYKATAAADTAKGVGSFVSGNGNQFSVFLQTQGVANGINYKSIYVISGTKTNTGIMNWQDCFQLTQKDSDPSGLLIKAGSTRIFKDQDGLSTITTYAIKPVTVSINTINKAELKGMLEAK